MEARTAERAALVALLRRPGVSWPEAALAIQETGSAAQVLDRALSEPLTLFDGASVTVDSMISTAATEIAEWEARGIGVHAFFDDAYPAPLRGIREMPPILFSRGELRTDDLAVAVVGSRRASDEGLRIARAVSKALVERGVTVASGLAEGIDTAAHTAALDIGGRTVAVIGTGITRYYPAANRALQEAIAEAGLVISQFWPDSAPSRQSFPMRNAVMSGYCAATIVVEAGEKSGARIQARLALQHGRPVILTSQVMHCEWATAFAGKPGVHVAGTLADLVAAVDEIVSSTPTGTGLESFPDLAIR